ncbi:MAG: hypothetical protein RR334_00705 [Clostridia bacterium]
MNKISQEQHESFLKQLPFITNIEGTISYGINKEGPLYFDKRESFCQVSFMGKVQNARVTLSEYQYNVQDKMLLASGKDAKIDKEMYVPVVISIDDVSNDDDKIEHSSMSILALYCFDEEKNKNVIETAFITKINVVKYILGRTAKFKELSFNAEFSDVGKNELRLSESSDKNNGSYGDIIIISNDIAPFSEITRYNNFEKLSTLFQNIIYSADLDNIAILREYNLMGIASKFILSLPKESENSFEIRLNRNGSNACPCDAEVEYVYDRINKISNVFPKYYDEKAKVGEISYNAYSEKAFEEGMRKQMERMLNFKKGNDEESEVHNTKL